MEFAAAFSVLTKEGLSFMEYSFQFCQLAQRTTFHDMTLKSLFWIGANYNHSVDLPDIKGDTEGSCPQMSGEHLPPTGTIRHVAKPRV